MRPKPRILHAASGKFGALLCALIALIAAAPMIAEARLWDLIPGLITGGVMIAGLYAARPSKRSLVLGLALAIFDLGVGRLVALENTRWLIYLQAFMWLTTMLYVTAAILETIFDSERVTLETLQAALCVYILLGLVWTYIYAPVALADPASFEFLRGPALRLSVAGTRRLEFMRLFTFSYAKLSGAGSSTLAPATGFASICACMEAMTGQVYLAVVIARLVGMHIVQTPTKTRTPSEPPAP